MEYWGPNWGLKDALEFAKRCRQVKLESGHALESIIVKNLSQKHVREAEDAEVAIRTATECEVEVVASVGRAAAHCGEGREQPVGASARDSQTSLSLRTTSGS